MYSPFLVSRKGLGMETYFAVGMVGFFFYFFLNTNQNSIRSLDEILQVLIEIVRVVLRHPNVFNLVLRG